MNFLFEKHVDFSFSGIETNCIPPVPKSYNFLRKVFASKNVKQKIPPFLDLRVKSVSVIRCEKIRGNLRFYWNFPIHLSKTMNKQQKQTSFAKNKRNKFRITFE